MDKRLLDFLKDLVNAPSPSGFEQRAQEVFRTFITPLSDEVNTDVHGNVIALKKGKGEKRIMLVGHADEIGFIVKFIDENGFIRFSAIGNVDYSLIAAWRVNIYHENKLVRGVVGVKPTYMYPNFERDKAITLDDLWIDIGAKDKKEAEQLVSVGDAGTFSPGWEIFPNDLFVSKANDNKVGVFVAAAVLNELENVETSANIYSVSSVQEEIGARGVRTCGYSVDPHIGIVVDLTHAVDHPTSDKTKYGEVALNKGVVITVGSNVNPRILEILKEAAKLSGIKFQLEAIPGWTYTDAKNLQINRAGVATAVLSIPCRYMHTQSEVVSLSDIESAVKLIAQFCKMIQDDTNLIP
jgi:endoglucanase